VPEAAALEAMAHCAQWNHDWEAWNSTGRLRDAPVEPIQLIVNQTASVGLAQSILGLTSREAIDILTSLPPLDYHRLGQDIDALAAIFGIEGIYFAGSTAISSSTSWVARGPLRQRQFTRLFLDGTDDEFARVTAAAFPIRSRMPMFPPERQV